MKYSKHNLFTLTINTNTIIDIRKKYVDEEMFHNFEMGVLYPNSRPIDEKKYKDLIDFHRYHPNIMTFIKIYDVTPMQ